MKVLSYNRKEVPLTINNLNESFIDLVYYQVKLLDCYTELIQN